MKLRRVWEKVLGRLAPAVKGRPAEPSDGNQLLLRGKDGTCRPVNAIKGLQIRFFGRNARVEVAEGAKFFKSKMILGDGARVRIGTTAGHGIRNTTIDMQSRDTDCALTIGNNISIASASIVVRNERNLDVRIGDDCMFSSRVVVRATDGHVIFDATTGEVINRAKPIVLGDHVWVGAGAAILRGAEIPSHTIVGTNAVVTRKFTEEYTALAGVPATVVRTNVNWDRQTIHDYEAGRGKEA